MNESMTITQAADILEKRMSRYHPNDDITAATQIAIDALRRAQPANEPLTLDELREMDGERVWSCRYDCYGILDARRPGDMAFVSADYREPLNTLDDYYRYKPEGSENNAE